MIKIPAGSNTTINGIRMDAIGALCEGREYTGATEAEQLIAQRCISTGHKMRGKGYKPEQVFLAMHDKAVTLAQKHDRRSDIHPPGSTDGGGDGPGLHPAVPGHPLRDR